MSTNFHESLPADTVAPPSERATGFVFAAVAVIVAVIWRSNVAVVVPALAIAAVFAGLAWRSPRRLRTLNVLWFKFGQALHVVMNPLVMGLLYLVAIVPMGLLMQRFRDPLRARRNSAAASYWVARLPANAATSSMKDQF